MRTILLFVAILLLFPVLVGCDLAVSTNAQALQPSPTLTVERIPTSATTSTPAETPTFIPAPTDTASPTVAPTDTATFTTTPEPPTFTTTPTPTLTPMPTATFTLEPDIPAAPTRTKTATPKPRQPAPTSTEIAVQPSATPDVAGSPEQGSSNGRTVNGKWYDAYVDAATKKKQYYHYTCEFDAAWVVLKSNGIDATLEDQIAIVGLDKSIEPYYKETGQGIFIYGGDILHTYSGDYVKNFLARSTGISMRRVFEHYGLTVTAVHTREDLQAQLRQGKLVWIKTTADFKPGRPATWVMPDGTTYETVLGNDHAAVVMGYSTRGALIRDVLGPTNTNWKREYEYEVPWPKFMAAWGQQQYDGLAVGR